MDVTNSIKAGIYKNIKENIAAITSAMLEIGTIFVLKTILRFKNYVKLWSGENSREGITEFTNEPHIGSPLFVQLDYIARYQAPSGESCS